MDQSSGQRIIPVKIEDQMKSAYIDYSMSVIVSRALPDVRDGLKPVHRRILYGMHELGVTYNKAYKKSARIVGEVLGKYHPHGDTAVYDTMVRMAQYWSLRYPLVDGQGNFGSMDGDSPAAMRYTEARMMRIADDFLGDIAKDTVDFDLNFDDTLKEPTVLPTRIPNLLVNGASGIAVGMATNMLPHNLSEVINGVIACLEKEDITIEELCEFAATKLSGESIIAWFQGRSEFGPRALGSRSLLMHPGPAENKDIINSRVKHREYWRPFAGIILEEHLTDYFNEDFNSPYMLYSLTVKDGREEELGAITHKDGTCRIQTVNNKMNEKVTTLLNKFKEVTGIPAILNTSFNDNGEPIVETPQDAVRSFKNMDIDYLIIDNFVVRK